MAEINNNANIPNINTKDKIDTKKSITPTGTDSFKAKFEKQIKETQAMQVFVNEEIAESSKRTMQNSDDLVDGVKDAQKSLNDLAGLMQKGRAIFDSINNNEKKS